MAVFLENGMVGELAAGDWVRVDLGCLQPALGGGLLFGGGGGGGLD